MHLKDDFGGGPISQVPASWFNSVAKFINNLIPGKGVVFTKSCDGTATVIELGDKMDSTLPTPTATKGISVHAPYPLLADFYDYPDKAAHPTDPAIVFPEWQARLDLTGEHEPPARMTGADNTTPVGWERGKTAWKNGHVVDASHPAVGCSMTVCTHMRQVLIDGTGKYQALFSRIEFDENGLLVRVVPCSNWYTLM